MTKVSRPTGLIGYDNDINVQRRISGNAGGVQAGAGANRRLPSLITVVCAVMLYALMSRTLLNVNVLHDRNPIAVRLSDGSTRNGYTLRFLNKRGFDRVIAIDVDGPAERQSFTSSARIPRTPDRPMIILGARHHHRTARMLMPAPFDEKAEKVSAGHLPHHRYRSPGEVASATRPFRSPITAEFIMAASSPAARPNHRTLRPDHDDRLLHSRHQRKHGHDAACYYDATWHRGRQRLQRQPCYQNEIMAARQQNERGWRRAHARILSGGRRRSAHRYRGARPRRRRSLELNFLRPSRTPYRSAC